MGVLLGLLDALRGLPAHVQAGIRAIADRSEWSMRHLLRSVIPPATPTLGGANEEIGFEGVDLEDLIERLDSGPGPIPRPSPPLGETPSTSPPLGETERGPGVEWGDLPPPPLGEAERQPAPADPSRAAAWFDDGGPLAGILPGYEARTEQTAMAEAVAGSFDEGGCLVVEAGTGVGKSLAYLLPAVRHAVGNGERVVVSTNTINLQEQLLTKDIPAALETLERAGEVEDLSLIHI